MSGPSRAVLAPFETYQKSRVTFVQTVAELAQRPQNIEALQSAGVMSLLRPLLLDNVPSIQQSAALALGRLANHSEELAEAVVSNEILPQLVYSLSEQNRYYKKAAAFVLRAVARHSEQLAKAVVNSGALDALVNCLEEFDPGVKEASAFALAYIAKHNAELAQAVVDAGAVPLLVICVEEPELNLKKIAAAALSETAHHNQELAQQVVDAAAVPILTALISHPNGPLKRHVCSCLSNIAKHTVDLAEQVVEHDLFPKILNCLKDTDMQVRKNAASCIREIAKHSKDLAEIIIQCGGHGTIVDYLSETKGQARLPGITTLGFISAFDESLADEVIRAKGVHPLKDALVNEPDDTVKATAAWSLGQIGRHSPNHAKALADADVPTRLMAVYVSPETQNEDLKIKAKHALKSIIKVCHHLPALEPLLQVAPMEILKHVVCQFANLLPNSVEDRKTFLQSGGFQKIQEIKAPAGSKLASYIAKIDAQYPPDVVQYYSPEYAQSLMKKVDDYHP